MHGVPLPERIAHTYVSIPRALHDLIFGPESDVPATTAVEMPVPEPRLVLITDYLRDWRPHPDVNDQVWKDSRERVQVASRLRFLLWAVRRGRISDGLP